MDLFEYRTVETEERRLREARGWSDAARAAALISRRAKAAGRKIAAIRSAQASASPSWLFTPTVNAERIMGREGAIRGHRSMSRRAFGPVAAKKNLSQRKSAKSRSRSVDPYSSAGRREYENHQLKLMGVRTRGRKLSFSR